MSIYVYIREIQNISLDDEPLYGDVEKLDYEQRIHSLVDGP
jgi:hypothetical protein